MKKIVCEMCESTNFSKVDGMFVCQDCGMKYSAEDAKKLMVEVEDDGASTPPAVATAPAPDNELENLYMLARRAKEDGNSENAAKYYEMILIKDPLSWEASFYSVYYKACSCKIAHIESAGNSVANNVSSTIALIKNHVAEGEQFAAVNEVSSRCISIAKMLASGAVNHYLGIADSIRDQYTQQMIDNRFAAFNILYDLGDEISCVYEDDESFMKVASILWRNATEMHKSVLSYLSDKTGNQRRIDSYLKKAAEYDEEFKKQLEDEKIKKEISYVRSQINSLNKKISGEEIIKQGSAGLRGFGWFATVVGVFFFFVGLILDPMFMIIALLEGGIGLAFVFGARTKKAVYTQQQLDEFRKEKTELQAKLAELESKKSK